MLRNLPSEIQQNIRSYGANPLITDEDLWQMILDIDPHYSLIIIHERVRDWISKLERLRKTSITSVIDPWDVYMQYLHEQKRYHLVEARTLSEIESDGMQTVDTIYVVDINNEDDEDEEVIEANLGPLSYDVESKQIHDQTLAKSVYALSKLMEYDPISPQIIGVFDNEVLFYEHVHTVGIPIPVLYEPFNAEIYKEIRALYPLYSLSKEYERLASLKKYRSSSQIDIQIIDMIESNISSVAFLPGEHSMIILYLFEDIKYNLHGRYHNQRNKIVLTNSTLEQYLSIVAYLWKGAILSSNQSVAKFSVPFANNV